MSARLTRLQAQRHCVPRRSADSTTFTITTVQDERGMFIAERTVKEFSSVID